MNGNRFSGDFSIPADMDADYDAAGADEGDGDGGGGGGLGNLADELADAWEEEEGEEDGYGYAPGAENEPTIEAQGNEDSNEDKKPDTGPEPTTEHMLHSHHLKQRLHHNGQNNRNRRPLSAYDGSDYGNDSDLEEAAEISPGLEKKMADIEHLARRGLENNGSESDRVIGRFIAGLRELSTQSAIENSAMRYSIPTYLYTYRSL